MSKFTFEKALDTAWCPGCGDHMILSTLVQVLNDMQLDPLQTVLVGGIGQAAKTNQYVNANGFSGLHGRSLPAAVGIKMANEKLTVIVNTGDGDSYGEGGNHFLHNIRRNVDITHFVHDNQIYGLTKGQTSPTSNACVPETMGTACNMNQPLNPMLLAIAAGATFVARSFSGKPQHLAKIMQAAIEHKGYSLVDILQPCVSFNKVNTFAYYNSRVYELEDGYDPTNKLTAIERSMEFDDRIPIGILYQNKGIPDYQSIRPDLYNGMAVGDKKTDSTQIDALINGFA